MVQWLRLHAAHAGGTGAVPVQGTTILHAMWCGQKIKKKKIIKMNKLSLKNKFCFPSNLLLLYFTKVSMHKLLKKKQSSQQVVQ